MIAPEILSFELVLLPAVCPMLGLSMWFGYYWKLLPEAASSSLSHDLATFELLPEAPKCWFQQFVPCFGWAHDLATFGCAGGPFFYFSLTPASGITRGMCVFVYLDKYIHERMFHWTYVVCGMLVGAEHAVLFAVTSAWLDEGSERDWDRANQSRPPT